MRCGVGKSRDSVRDASLHVENSAHNHSYMHITTDGPVPVRTCISIHLSVRPFALAYRNEQTGVM